MQTCLNYVAANSAVRSGLDFMLTQVGERNKETKTQNAETPSSILLENFLFNLFLSYRSSEGHILVPLMEYAEESFSPQFSGGIKTETDGKPNVV